MVYLIHIFLQTKLIKNETKYVSVNSNVPNEKTYSIFSEVYNDIVQLGHIASNGFMSYCNIEEMQYYKFPSKIITFYYPKASVL